QWHEGEFQLRTAVLAAPSSVLPEPNRGVNHRSPSAAESAARSLTDAHSRRLQRLASLETAEPQEKPSAEEYCGRHRSEHAGSTDRESAGHLQMYRLSCDSASEFQASTRIRAVSSCQDRRHQLVLLLSCAAMMAAAADPHAPAAVPPRRKSADRERPYQKPDRRGRCSLRPEALPAWHS